MLYFTSHVNESLIVPHSKESNKLLLSLYLICFISPLTFSPAPCEVHISTKTSHRLREPKTGCHCFLQLSLFDSQCWFSGPHLITFWPTSTLKSLSELRKVCVDNQTTTDSKVMQLQKLQFLLICQHFFPGLPHVHTHNNTR